MKVCMIWEVWAFYKPFFESSNALQTNVQTGGTSAILVSLLFNDAPFSTL